MLNFVVALQPEARPILSRYLLQALDSSTDFPLYSGGNLRLIVSGVGRMAAAMAVAYLRGTQPQTPAAWLNIGVAGHGQHPVGTPLLGHKIADRAGTRSYYPSFPFQPPCQTTTVLTVDRPEERYEKPWAYDMEASGFCAAASRFSTAELVHCLKIASDNPDSSLGQVSKKQVEDLIAPHLDLVDTLVQTLSPLADQLAARGQDPPFFAEFLQRWHFTVAQRHQLHRLLRRWHTLAPDQTLWDDEIEVLPKGGDILCFLEQRLDTLPVDPL